MRSTGLIAIVLVLAVTPVAAQVSATYETWVDGPEGYLLTPAERAAWGTITDDVEAEGFIELFWARRDPDLSTRENEFRSEFALRVETADAELGAGDERGAMTDRGRTLLLLGVPTEHARMPISEYLSQLYRSGRAPEGRSSDREAYVQMHGVTFNVHTGVADLWGYRQDDLPAAIEWPKDTEMITFAFFDHDGTGDFQTQLGIRRAQQAADVLAAAPTALVVNPELESVPVYGLIPGIAAAGAEEVEWLSTEVELEGVIAAVETGVGGRGILVSWLSLRIPETDAGPWTLVGLLTSGDTAVGSFMLAFEPVVGPLGSTCEMTLPVPPGDHVLELALAQGGAPVHVERLDVHVDAFEGTYLTPVFSGAEVQRDETAAAGDPFVFGGYHLAWRPDGRFLPSEDIALFSLLTVSDGAAEPRIGSVAMRWYVDGKPTPKQPARQAQFQPAGDGQWVWGTQLPLASLGPDHDYELKITVEDSGSGVSRTTKIPVLIGE